MDLNFWIAVMRSPDKLTPGQRDTLLEDYRSMTRDQVYEKAKKKKVLPFAAHTLTALDCDRDFWSPIHEGYEKRTEQVIELTDRVFRMFAEAEIRSPCMTENFGAMLVSGSCRGCFCSGDVDVSADPGEQEAIRRVLTDRGFQRTVRKNYRQDIEEDEFRAPELLEGEPFYINICYHPVIREKLYTVDQRLMEPWLRQRRLQAGTWGDTAIRIMGPEDTLIHCIYHLSAGHYYTAKPGIRLYTEPDRIITGCTLDWQRILSDCRRLKVEKRLYTALKITRETLGTEVPQWILREPDNQTEKLIRMLLREQEGRLELYEIRSGRDKLLADLRSEPGCLAAGAWRKLCYGVRNYKK